MSFDGFDDELYWNENQWEAHLNELEKRSEQLRKFITSDPSGRRPRWLTLLQENMDEDEAVDAFIEEELLLDDAYFPEDEDEWEDDDEEFDQDDYFFLMENMPFADDDEEDEDDFDSGEEWKSLSDEYTYYDYVSLRNMPLYQEARALAVETLKWAEGIPEKGHNATCHDFISDTLRIGAKLAGGFSFGYEREYLGGNIAYTKRALYCANSALGLLQKQKGSSYFTTEFYSFLHMRLFNLRNEIGVYVQELRDRFNYGLD
ncbi:MAG: hypothetical protein WDZ29_02280 [Balneolaceae bacterium]